MPTPRPTTVELVTRFADEVNTALTTTHAVTSPLGLWLLLALTAPATTGADRATVEAALGTGVQDAQARAGQILAAPHPAVPSAVALWARESRLTPDYRTWVADLPAAVHAADLPTRADANAWASQHTLGLIETFPVTIDEATAFVLATAVAARVSWAQPFTDAAPTELGGPLGARTTTALRAPDTHSKFLATTAAAGLVGVHAAVSTTGLAVVSVIGAADAVPAAMHRAGTEVAALLAGGATTAAVVSLFDLPAGPGHAWDITESIRQAMTSGDRTQHVGAVLAPWEATTDHSLSDIPAVAAAMNSLRSFVRPAAGPAAAQARQVARAQYTREGFAAAAVTATRIYAVNAITPRTVTHREATVRFNRPYAVLAVATNRGVAPGTGRQMGPGAPAWDGLPVFSAWVEHPSA